MGSQVAKSTADARPTELEAGAHSESGEEWSLLPGIPDEITVNHILVRVLWRDMYIAASLSRAWHRAVKSRDVYAARIRAKCTQKLAAMIHLRNDGSALSLYDSSDNRWHLVPRMPSGLWGIPQECGCVSLWGKLYIIGGWGQSAMELRAEVYAFNLVGQSGWKQCASMKTGRAAFACQVKEGKIYVFGGMGAKGVAEVYDPEKDAWHGIAPMLSNRMHHEVVNVGGEFYVQLRKILGRNHMVDAKFCEIYDPRNDHWRKVENGNFNTSGRAVIAEAIFMNEGTVHKILDDVLHVFDESSSSWKASQSISWDVFEGRGANNRTLPYADAASAIAVDRELVALVYGRTPGGYMRLTPLISHGLGATDQKLAWKRIWFSFDFPDSHSLCAVDL